MLDIVYCLVEDVGIEDGNSWTFISDQQKGLENAVHILAPYADHRNCARHAYMNWKKSHNGSTLKNLFWRAARSTYVKEFKLAIQDMKIESLVAFEDFMARDTTRFCKAFLSTSACSDMIDNNITKTFIPFPALGGKFEVHYETDKFVVDLSNRAISAIQFMKLDPADYVSDCYTVKRYLEGYQIGLPPVMGEKIWPDVEGFTVKPPIVRKRASRPKKKRIRAPEEKDGKLTKHGAIMTCNKCQGKGHNNKGCKNQQVHKKPTEKRKRGRLAKPKETSTLKNKKSSAKLMKSTIHKERAFAKKGLGVFTASSGNVYVCPSTSNMRVTSVNTISNTNASTTQEPST